MKQPEIIYVYDAYCGWCYGFSKVIKQLHEEYKSQFQFTVISGGMITGDRVAPLAQMAGYIKKAHKTVEEYSGVQFGKPFLEGTLENPDYISDSEVPSIAMAVFKSYDEPNAIPFAHGIQQAFYYEGKDLNAVKTYTDLASNFDIPEAEFAQKMKEPAFKMQAHQEFRISNQLGVRGFPTLIYQDEENLAAITRGFQPYEQVKGVFEQLVGLAK